MASERSSVPLTTPRSRPRAATEMSPIATTSPFPLRRSSQGYGHSLGRSIDARPRCVSGRFGYTRSYSEHGRVWTSIQTEADAGPLRHPKLLTPSDIHSLMEQEHEALVNRLSRELSLLRQQTASAASTTSSTSTTFTEALDSIHGTTYINGPIYPTASRRHRSSSSLSASYFPIIQGSRTSSISGITPSREPYQPSSGARDPSRTRGRSRDTQVDSTAPFTHSPRVHRHRSSLSQQRRPSYSNVARPEEAAHHRGELESVKRENEALRQRIRELENELRLKTDVTH